MVILGSYQKSIGQERAISFSQPSVSRAIHEVSKVIDNHLAPRFIKFPTAQHRKNQIKEDFYRKFLLPGIIGCIDCTHVSIKRPKREIEQAYYAVRKAAHTKNVQVICDANYTILNVNAKFGGASHDSHVFRSSNVSEILRERHVHNERNSWLLGDSGYAQMPYLMTPVANPQSPREEAYNRAHKKARCTVERCIGVLKSRFRCLSRQRILMYSPNRAGAIINACSTLHNIMIAEGYPLPSEEEILEEVVNDENAEHLQHGETEIDSVALLEEGRRQRLNLIQSYF
ncbi:putative nuclease HARBI1 [Lutzomyia longipalpis]|uniref:putative nuclease HARBI1 n=1 Tax=Lutzomyia longipalpis TaxID=7200 RepID=UPI002483E9A0|nr:putative nuclease HARBI1 [Lutzomyia longipalpis]